MPTTLQTYIIVKFNKKDRQDVTSGVYLSTIRIEHRRLASASCSSTCDAHVSVVHRLYRDRVILRRNKHNYVLKRVHNNCLAVNPERRPSRIETCAHLPEHALTSASLLLFVTAVRTCRWFDNVAAVGWLHTCTHSTSSRELKYATALTLRCSSAGSLKRNRFMQTKQL